MALKNREETKRKPIDEDEEEEQPKKKKSPPVEKDEDEEEEESEDVDEDFFDAPLTPEDIKRILTDPNHIPAGEYECKVISYRLVKPITRDPKKGPMPGGIEVAFKITEPPADAEKPETGWPQLKRLFRKWPKPTEGQKSQQAMDRQDWYRLVIATLGEIDKETTDLKAAEAMKGSSVLIRVSHNESSDGRKFQNIGWFKEA